jgi:hypothetical protein
MGLAPIAPIAPITLLALLAPRAPGTAPSGFPLAVVPGDGAVEVVRGAVAGPAALGSVVAWATAGAAVVVLVAAVLLGAERRSVIAPAWWIAVAATLTELVVLLLDGAVTERRPTAALARLLLLAVGLVAAGGLPRWTELVVTVLLLLTVPLGAPLAGDLDGVAVAAGLALLELGLALAVLWVVTRRAQPGTGIALGLVTVLALPAAALAWPAAPPLVHRAQVVADGTVVDVTVAPVAPGRNELHLYARDAAGQPVGLTDVRAEVAGLPSQELFPVTPDHWLSYVLDLPPGDRWRLTLTGATTDGEERSIVLDLVAP